MNQGTEGQLRSNRTLAREVAACCSRAIGEPLGTTDNFFLAGLDSLGAVKLAAAVVELDGIECAHADALEAVFAYPDAESLAAWLQHAGSDGAQSGL